MIQHVSPNTHKPTSHSKKFTIWNSVLATVISIVLSEIINCKMLFHFQEPLSYRGTYIIFTYLCICNDDDMFTWEVLLAWDGGIWFLPVCLYFVLVGCFGLLLSKDWVLTFLIVVLSLKSQNRYKYFNKGLNLHLREHPRKTCCKKRK